MYCSFHCCVKILSFSDASIKFIEWLYRFVMFNLFPGSCFQRRRTCLDIIQIWFETVIFMESDGAKKGKAQGTATLCVHTN